MKYPRRSIALFLFVCAYMFSSVVSAETYYVATSGSDSGTGSLSRPFGSISAASSVMVEGDTCMIYGGIYRETIIPLVDDVSYQAVQGEEVTLTGFDAVDSWSVYSESIYVADIDWTLGEEDQVFFDGKMMTLARWPNKTNDNLFDLEMQKASGTNSSVSHASIPDQNWANGGVILFLGKSRWTSWRVDVTQSENGMVGFDELSTNWDFSGAHSPTLGGEFYLMNTLEALDNEEEWYIDRANGKVYLYAPGGVDPDTGDALVRRRTTLAALNGREGVTLNNLVFFGGNVNLKGSKDCTIKHCRIRYGNHTIASNSGAVIPHASIVMDGDSVGNTIYRNEVQWGAGSGVVVNGLGNVVDNNIIGNFDYLGCYSSPVEMRGTNNNITRNEIFNGGRDCVRGGGVDLDFGYNNVHHANLINDDCGGIYMCCGNYPGTRIHHNWIHDIESRDNNYSSYKATGVYLDNSTVGVTVDHNVFWNLEWSCIQINWQGEDLELHNNTLWSNSGDNSSSMKRWVNGYEFFNVNLYNTLANEADFHANDVSNSCVLDLDADPFEDFANQNFVPKEGSCAIDGGREIPGITGEFVGSAPDIGAYERGAYVWTPGPDWKLTDSLFEENGPIVGYRYDSDNNTLDLVCSNLTIGRGHNLLASDGLSDWTVIDSFIAPDAGEYEYEDFEIDSYRFFQVVEKIAIPVQVNFVSAALQRDDLTIILKFDRGIIDPSNDIQNMSLIVDEVALPIQSATLDQDDSRIVSLKVETAILEDQVVQFSYSPGVAGESGGPIAEIMRTIVDTSISDENLVAGKNGDGENGNDSGWSFGENGAFNSKISRVQSPVHSGGSAIQAVYDSSVGNGLINLRHSGGTFMAKAGATYDISIWHYGKDLDTITRYTTELSVYNARTGEVLDDKRTWASSVPNQWNQTTARVSFTAQEAGEHVLGFRMYGGHYIIIVDDVSVIRFE